MEYLLLLDTLWEQGQSNYYTLFSVIEGQINEMYYRLKKSRY